MRVFLCRNSCLLLEAIVCGYNSAQEALEAYRKELVAGGHAYCDILSNYEVNEVTAPCIIYRELEEDDLT